MGPLKVMTSPKPGEAAMDIRANPRGLVQRGFV
ncbi:uncharacterized protein CCOS01_06698 [Colletotrichum costaricense]|uniref:Uncharacterized protein n=1 Tax=Colletotrichum costaricense TaxID=1209916 RepID=A0AAI9YYM0_9PEZI|nr:uncharacterized protein CCOS01_06698 [Colletotrichum costaricense]KAI3532754.1 hypothetical protein CSPX01_13214 [Colletotrichum filicis]KAK1528864.1 hypothetical protein CCOS01_06698 [Colletotrichum costaricense]